MHVIRNRTNQIKYKLSIILISVFLLNPVAGICGPQLDSVDTANCSQLKGNHKLRWQNSSNKSRLVEDKQNEQSENISQKMFVFSMNVTIGDLLVIITILVIAYQTYLLRRQMEDNLIVDMYGKWIEIGKLEALYPEFHKMFMDINTYEKLQSLPEQELRQRALAVIMLDTINMILKLQTGKHLEESKIYFRKVLENPILCKCWIDYGLREAWEGTKFKEYVDSIVYRHHSTNEKTNNDKSA